jgi:hypothetical protein
MATNHLKYNVFALKVANKMAARSLLRLFAVLLVGPSIYYTYQTHKKLAVVTDFMKSLTSVPYEMPETETDDDDDDENNTSTTSPSKSTSTNTLGQVRAYPEEDDSLFDEDGDGDSTNDDLTPFHNKTHITCFYKRKERWYKEVVTPDVFWSKNRCKFRVGLDTVYFHQGKTGGGAVGYMGEKYRLNLRNVHPTINEKSVQDLMNGPLTSLIFTVRDPVDRFVSMFNWRLLTLCHPGDKRKKTIAPQDAKAPNEKEYGGKHRYFKHTGTRKIIGRHTERPDKYCLSTRAEQEKTLRVNYKGDPNVMAESLCEESSNYEQAVRDLTDINHSTMISQWLEFLIDPKTVRNITTDGIKNFIAVPLNSRFEDNLNAMFEIMLKERYGDNILDYMGNRPAKQLKLKKTKERTAHSSEKHGKDMPKKLTKLAECCLTRFYQNDYQVIQTMLGYDANAALKPIEGAHEVVSKACDWGDSKHQESCKEDLHSMIKLRSHYIFGSEQQTCSELLT